MIYPTFNHVYETLPMHDESSPIALDRWPLRGGVACLDLANTEAFRGTDHQMDLLESYDMLIAWSTAAGAIQPAEAGPLLVLATADPDLAARHLAQVKELREAVHAVMQSVAHQAGAPLAALATLNDFLAESLPHARIVQSTVGFEFRFLPENDLALPVWRLSDSAARLLVSPDRALVRECPGHECGWLFLDTTKNHSRRWCHSQDCGNRARVRAYSRRKREAALA